MAYVCLYSPDLHHLTVSELRSLSGDAEVALVRGDAGDVHRATVTWPDARLTLTVLDAGQLGPHLSRVLDLVAAAAGHPVLRARLSRVRQVVGIGAEPCFDGAPEQVVRMLGLRRRALELRAGGLYEPAGGCLHELGSAWMARVVQSLDQDPPVVAPLPEPAHVLARARVLAAVAHRARLEDPRTAGRDVALAELRAWLWHGDLDDLMEPEERELLDAPLGAPWRSDVASAARRLEGAAVLAWALGWMKLPAHDQATEPDAVHQALGFLAPASTHGDAHASLREPALLRAMGERLRALEWRLHVLPARALDFQRLCLEHRLGPIDLGGVALVDDDLALGGVRVSDAPLEQVERALAIARERHHALRWLVAGAARYAELAPVPKLIPA